VWTRDQVAVSVDSATVIGVFLNPAIQTEHVTRTWSIGFDQDVDGATTERGDRFAAAPVALLRGPLVMPQREERAAAVTVLAFKAR
jgi:hypothetical protein